MGNYSVPLLPYLSVSMIIKETVTEQKLVLLHTVSPEQTVWHLKLSTSQVLEIPAAVQTELMSKMACAHLCSLRMKRRAIWRAWTTSAWMRRCLSKRSLPPQPAVSCLTSASPGQGDDLEVGVVWTWRVGFSDTHRKLWLCSAEFLHL